MEKKIRREARLVAKISQTHELFAQAVIDALTSHICVLDNTGTILAANAAWRHFYDENSGATPGYNYGIGGNYLAVCDNAEVSVENYGPQMYKGLKKVMSGQIREFSLEYPCDSPTEERWFIARVTRFSGSSGNIVIAHEDITLRKKYEREIEKLSQRLLGISETERAWVARELHESIAQDLSLLKLHLQAPQAADAREGQGGLIDKMLGSLRQMSEALSPVHLESIGLPMAIEHMIDEVAAATGIRYTLNLRHLENFFPGNWNIGLYRIIEHCVRRIPHALPGSSFSIIAEKQASGICVILECDSPGQEEEDVPGKLDLLLMQQRAYSFGASVIPEFDKSGRRLAIYIAERN